MHSTCLHRSHAPCKSLVYHWIHTCAAAGLSTGGERPRSDAGGGGGDLANTCMYGTTCFVRRNLLKRDNMHAGAPVLYATASNDAARASLRQAPVISWVSAERSMTILVSEDQNQERACTPKSSACRPPALNACRAWEPCSPLPSTCACALSPQPAASLGGTCSCNRGAPQARSPAASAAPHSVAPASPWRAAGEGLAAGSARQGSALASTGPSGAQRRLGTLR